ncbi:MAG: hypothetical protein V1799_14690 [bacterium]
MIVRIAQCLMIVLGVVSSPAIAFQATEDVKPAFQTVRIPRPLQLTGKLDDPLWKQAKPIQLAYEIQPGVYFTLKGQTQVQVDYLLINDEMFRGVWFDDIRRLLFFVNAQPWNELSLSMNGQAGKFIYRSSSPAKGSGHNFSGTVTLKPTSKLQLNLSYSRARLSKDASGELLYDGNIYRIVGIYQFTPEIFFRTIAQYNSFDKSLNLYPLFNYKLNAFTTFYAGITNDFLDYDEPNGFATTARQYFVKIQYLLGS